MLTNTPTPDSKLLGAVAGAAAAPAANMIHVPVDYFQAITMLFGIVAVVLARMVFIDDENKKLGRKQTLRETLPLTGVALVFAAPLMWQNRMSIVLPVFIGAGVGYSTILFLKIGVRVALGTVRSVAKEVLAALPDMPVSAEPDDDAEKLIAQLDNVPDVPPAEKPAG